MSLARHTRRMAGSATLALAAGMAIPTDGEAKDRAVRTPDRIHARVAADTALEDLAAISGSQARAAVTAVASSDAGQLPEASIPTLAPRRHVPADEAAHRAARDREAEALASPHGRLGTPLDTAGGDDVEIMSHDIIAQEYAYGIAITEAGDIFAAVQVADAESGSEIHVYRSNDGGDSWSLWGLRSAASPDLTYRKPSLHVAEGAEDRLYLAYEFRNANADDVVNVACADIADANAVWSVASAFSQPGVDFRNPDISSDGVNFNGYRVYVVAEELDGTADDIWFARSTDFGASFEPEYEIGTLGGNTTDYRKPKVTYGVSGVVHVVWYRGTFSDDSVDDAIRYRRATAFAGGGIGAWDGVRAITSTADGFDDDDPTVAAQHGSNQVVLNFTTVPEGGGVIQNTVRLSDDAGVTWDPADEGHAPVVLRPHVLALSGGYRLWGSRYISASYGFCSSTTGAPLTFTDPEILADETYFGLGIVHHAMCAIDPSRGNRVAAIWSERNADGPDRLWFDAEWRADPGYPNHNPNFPVPLAVAPVTPPALADFDGDMRVPEIVFGDEAGDVHVFDRFGLEVPGFPVSTGQNLSDESLAVGDVTNDGFPNVVVGTDRGQVFCWDHQGQLVDGWPRELGPLAPAHVSLGTVSGMQPNDVVATCDDQIFLLRFDGTDHVYAPFPITNPEALRAAAAIGDLDMDGDAEIVVAAGDKMRVYDRMGQSGVLRTLAGTDLSETPSLGDVDQDGAGLEIVVPTNTGEVWAFEHTGSGYPGFPFDTGSGDVLTEVAIANAVLSVIDDELELAFARRNSSVYFGVGGNVYPTSPGWFLLGAPIIDDVDENAFAEVAIGDRGTRGWAWDAFGNALPAWPKALGNQVNVSPASGDIDGDGKVEIVLLTDTELVVLDVNAALEEDETQRWPQYGHDARRTSCADCTDPLVVGVDDPGSPSIATGATLAAPSPNPTHGPAVFVYALAEQAVVRLDIFDVQGRHVRGVVKDEQAPGRYDVSWDGTDAASRAVAPGSYVARLLVRSGASTEQRTRKIVVTP